MLLCKFSYNFAQKKSKATDALLTGGIRESLTLLSLPPSFKIKHEFNKKL